MTNTVVNFSSNQTISNELLSRSDVQALVDASLITGGIPTFSNSVSYVTGNVVYYLGIYYIAPSNISSGGGTPLANTTWKQIPTWGSYTTTVSSAATVTMDLYSSEIQRISGTTTHTFILPVASTLPALGKPFYFINDSTGTVTINSSGANLVATILAGQRFLINNILLSGTTAASWTIASGYETTTTIGALMLGATTKATPVDADILALSDSASSNILKGLTWANLKATLLTTWKDATGGLAGLTLFKINFKNAANTFTSFFTNANTAARTYTFQDRDGTIADDTNLALKANLASPTFTGTVVIPTPFTLGAVSVLPTGTELNYVDGVTSSIQTQLDSKAPLASPTFTGTVSGEAATLTGLLTTNGQVSFPATANPSADANTLDDFEEGTFSPTFQDSSYSDAESQTYTTQSGAYQKIGSWVKFKLYINVLSAGTLTAGSACYIAGLPFTPDISSGGFSAIASSNGYDLSITAGNYVGGAMDTTGARVTLQKWGSTIGASGLLVSEFATGEITLSGFYKI